MQSWDYRPRTAVTPGDPGRPRPEAAIGLAALEHGAYYAGRLGPTRCVARWHARKRRFVLERYVLGAKQLIAAAHVDEGGTLETFAPLTRTEPNPACSLSDYAFETAR